MKCVLLAAGYATRLYPLTKERPKSLLRIGDGNILEFIIRKIEQVGVVDHIIIVSNDLFKRQFEEWIVQYPTTKKITVLSDGSTTNENRLGAIGDLDFVITHGKIDEDILVMAGDNVFDLSLVDFVNFFYSMKQDCITTYELSDLNALRRTGVIEISLQQKVLAFEEKPSEPKSNLAVPPIYIYKRDTLPLVKQYLDAGNNPDAPGNFIPWLMRQHDVYAYKFQGCRFDIGTMESYQEACRAFQHRMPPKADVINNNK